MADLRQVTRADEETGGIQAVFAAIVAAGQLDAAQQQMEAQARHARAGNLAARDALYYAMEGRLLEAARPALRRVARLGGARLAEADVQQQLFVLFCTLLESWQPDRGPFAAYLHRALARDLARYLRAALVLPETAGLDPALLDDPGDGPVAPDPAEVYARHADWDAALTQLDPRSRRLVQWHLFDDQPLDVVAARLGLCPRHTARLLAAACATLRHVLGLHPPGS
jgi:RNA polymerase sigma factor (sigma-70 family)